jgi:membrane-bound lytic murein transglycosylase D
MIRLLFTYIFSLLALTSQAQTFTKPEVPDVINFAGMKLELTSSAKRKIEADVTMIYNSGKYLQQKIDRANLYFPIIEHVFHEEGFPEEFKYLALQESSLVSDAVSSSNAVGFWQFKKETAIEVGVTVNANVDERKHISYASRGAAKYIKKNNLLLDNWVYALLSYNVGPGGVKSHVKSKNVGAKTMVIDDDIHWYVIRFLAYKIAYENLVGKATHPELMLVEYKGIKDKSLQDIARQAKVDSELLKEYNKWCTNGHVPNDKEYIVIVPARLGSTPIVEDNTTVPEPIVIAPIPKTNTRNYPDIASYTDSSLIPVFVSINRVNAIRAGKGDDINSLLSKAQMSRKSFLYFNELKGYEPIVVGSFYYLQLKRSKALVSYHTVLKGETIHSIAQKYAITTGSIRKHNRLEKKETLKENRILWLRNTRPKTAPVEYKAASVKNDEIKQEHLVVTPKENVVTPVVVVPTITNNLEADAIYHVVKPGETVFGISRTYEVDSDSIRTWNHLTGYEIKVNQNLIVGYKKNASTEVLYTVKSGDTVYKISKQFNVSADEIKKWNGLLDYNLSVGQQLKIYLP